MYFDVSFPQVGLLSVQHPSPSPLAVLFGLLKRIYKRNLENKIEKLQRCVYHQFKLKHRADKKRILERKENKTEHCSTPTFFSFSS